MTPVYEKAEFVQIGGPQSGLHIAGIVPPPPSPSLLSQYAQEVNNPTPASLNPDVALGLQIQANNHNTQNIRLQLQMDEVEEKATVTESELKIVQQGLTQFSCDIAGILSKTGKNYCFAPISLAIVMGMVLKAMPYGQAKQKMLEALHLEKLRESRAHAALGCLANKLISDGAELRVANGMVVSKDVKVPINEEYLTTIQKTYAGKIFSTDGANFVPAINAWVSEKTKGMIPKLIQDEKMFEGQEVHVALLNAIFFAGNWAQKFDPKNTKPGPFKQENGTIEKVMMMFQKNDFHLCYEDSFQMLRLPYAGTDLSYLIFLPHDNVKIAELEAKLTPEVIRKSMESSSEREVNVTIPKIEIDWHMEMKDIFRSMGMPVDEKMFNLAFDRHKLLTVLHQTKMIVDESGTKAAAATVAVGGYECGSRSGEFHVLKPHVVLLMKGNDILFQACIKDASVMIKAPQKDTSAVKKTALSKDEVANAVSSDAFFKAMVPQSRKRTVEQAIAEATLTHFEIANKDEAGKSAHFEILNYTSHLIEMDNDGILTLDCRNVRENFTRDEALKCMKKGSKIVVMESFGNLYVVEEELPCPPYAPRRKERPIEFV